MIYSLAHDEIEEVVSDEVEHFTLEFIEEGEYEDDIELTHLNLAFVNFGGEAQVNDILHLRSLLKEIGYIAIVCLRDGDVCLEILMTSDVHDRLQNQ